MSNSTQKRYYLIDSIRGFALINMVLFHLLYDIFMIYSPSKGWALNPFTIAWERMICFTFITVSGISLNFSRKPIKRGVIVFLISVGITAVTYFFMPSELIIFGILSFLGFAMIVCGALKNLLNRVNSLIGTIASLLLFAVFYGLPERYFGFFGIKIFDLPSQMYQFNILAPFGLPSPGFRSSDYFPIFPWIFLFVFGFFLWKLIREHGTDRFFTLKVPFLDLVGRHSLIIYIVHQPIIMLILNFL